MRGYIEVDQDCCGRLWWKRCETDDCKNLVCIGISRTLCFPCSGASKEQLDNGLTVIHGITQKLLM
jgi:hypothetical protein